MFSFIRETCRHLDDGPRLVRANFPDLLFYLGLADVCLRSGLLPECDVQRRALLSSDDCGLDPDLAKY